MNLIKNSKGKLIYDQEIYIYIYIISNKRNYYVGPDLWNKIDRRICFRKCKQPINKKW